MPEEWIETPTWRKVAQRILQTCNEQPDTHERFMEMCGKVAGRWRTILGSSPEEMDVPIKVGHRGDAKYVREKSAGTGRG